MAGSPGCPERCPGLGMLVKDGKTLPKGSGAEAALALVLAPASGTRCLGRAVTRSVEKENFFNYENKNIPKRGTT